jgi:UDP-GlcNAc3NAcA epimerase
MKLVSIVGARPQFVKASTVSRMLAATSTFREVLVHTGQHYDKNMSDVFFSELGIPEPSYNLAVGSASHGAQTGRMLEAIETVLETEKPDWVLVYGDTNSTIAGALAATKLHIPVAHVEAGLRSFNRAMPEEVNRVLTDHVSDLLFAPTDSAVTNLRNEGIHSDKIALVGDVMYDTAIYFRQHAIDTSRIRDSLALKEGHYVLATIHRAENTDDPDRLQAIIGALIDLSRDLCVVLPMHPRTRQAVRNAGITIPDGLRLIDPVSYLDMVMLESGARMIVTDSGGVQKEAFFFKVPCVTLRDETEWAELVKGGWNRLVPPKSRAAINEGFESALRDGTSKEWPSTLYGDGNAAGAIVERLARWHRDRKAA